MRITRLEIFGFKSFVDRFVLNFDTELIGVVGPNGCGKSNVVDALRWVLGETHAKQLRGSVLEDLIFDGSESRRPLGMAEVSITIRPDENWYQGEVKSESDFLADALVEDIEDTGETEEGDQEPSQEDQASSLPHGFVVLEGGKDKDPADQDQPEAAGVTNQILPDSILSIPGLFSASEIQLTRRLYRSGESEYFINKAPCRLRDMVDLYRVIGLGARGLSIVQQGTIGDIVKKKPVDRRELLEEAAGIAGIRARLEAANRKLDRTSDNLARLQDIITEVDKQVRSLDRQAKRAEKRKELKAGLLELETRQFVARSARIVVDKTSKEDAIKKLEQDIEEGKASLSTAEAEEERAKAELQQIEVSLVQKRRERDALLSELNQARKAESDARVSVAKLEASLNTLSQTIETNGQRKEEAGVEIEKFLSRIDSANQQLADFQDRRDGVEVEFAGVEIEQSDSVSGNENLAASTSLSAQLEALEAVYRGHKDDIVSFRDGYHSKRNQETELKVKVSAIESEISSIEKNLESISKEVTASGSNDQLEGKALIEGLIVPEQLEKATATALGKSASFKVVKEQAALSGLKAVVGGIISPLLEDQSITVLNSEDSFLSKLEVRSGFESAAQALLSNVALVGSVDEGVRLVKKYNSPLVSAVTEEGMLITSWGVVGEEGSGHHLGMMRRLEELQESLSVEQNKLEETQQGIAAEQQKISEKERGLNESETALARLRGEQKELSLEAERARDRAVAREREFQRKLQEIKSEEVKVQSEIGYMEREIEKLRNEVQKIEQDADSLSAEKETLIEKKQYVGEQLSIQFEDPNSPTRRRAHELEDNLIILDQDIKSIEGSFDHKRSELYDSKEKFGSSQAAYNRLNNRLSEMRLDAEKGDIELNLLVEEFKRNQGEEIPVPGESQILAVIEEAGSGIASYLSEVNQELGDLRSKLEKVGEVDPEAVLRFQEEGERLEGLKVQHEDLDSARKTLIRTIAELKEVSNKRFLHAFEFVSKKFSELVPRLYGGGAGSLQLIDPEDPLTSGVELTVRPPGKKLKSIELMSGGEQALAATAVIVAMFLYKPSPICVLDEVDAPLDDANLDRFLTLIKEISGSTQFLIVTHNKQTMAVVNRLLGITMEEKGVSRALEVDLEEAEKVVVNG